MWFQPSGRCRRLTWDRMTLAAVFRPSCTKQPAEDTLLTYLLTICPPHHHTPRTHRAEPAGGSSGADSSTGIAALGNGSIAGSCEHVSIASADDDIGDNSVPKDCIAALLVAAWGV
eukprot:3941172-Rhodomonas_salina.2